MPTIIDGSGSADFQTPLPLGEGGTGSVVGALSGPNGSAFALRNRIINGDMRIDQRNSGGAVTATTSASYVLDRFFSQNNAGGTITIQQSTLGISRSHRATVTSAVTDLSGALQVQVGSHLIEAQNCFDLNGKPINISFRVETNWSGNFAVAISNSDATRSYIVNVPVVSGTNTVSVPITLEAGSVLTNTNANGLRISFGYNNEGSRTSATTNAWVSGFFGCSTASTQWTKTTGNFVNVTEVQLEEGSVATPFERRPIGVELALCQRYLPAWNGSNNYFSGQAVSASLSYVRLNLAVAARVPPTGMTTSAIAGTNFIVYNSGGSGVNVTALSFVFASTNSVLITATVASGLTAGDSAGLNTSVASAQILLTGCEL